MAEKFVDVDFENEKLVLDEGKPVSRHEYQFENVGYNEDGNARIRITRLDRLEASVARTKVEIRNEKRTSRLEAHGHLQRLKETDEWTVTATSDTGAVEDALFTGPNAEERARGYAIDQYGGAWNYRHLRLTVDKSYARKGLDKEMMESPNWEPLDGLDIDNIVPVGNFIIFIKEQRRGSDTEPWKDTGKVFIGRRGV